MIKRILLIHDEPGAPGLLDAILRDVPPSEGLAPPPAPAPRPREIQIDHALGAGQGLELARQAIRQREPYLVAVIDLRLESDCEAAHLFSNLWELDPALFLLVWENRDEADRIALTRELGHPDQILFLSKPVCPLQTRQWIVSLVDRRWMRESLQQKNSELESTRRALEQARESVEEAARAKSDFVANMTHEMRTPMNAVLGFSQLLAKEPLNDEQLRKVQYIRDAGQSLMHLITHVLDYSKLAMGQWTLKSSVFRLDDVLGDVLEKNRRAALDKGLAIHCRVEQGVPRELQGDKARFRQILANLVDNAIKFTEQGSVHVRVTLDEQTEDAVTLRVVVTDTGVGIPLDRQEVVFDGFVQADASATRNFEGVGLGLAICRHIVELMQGQIGVRSTPGKGSSFWFTATLKRRHALSSENAHSEGSGFQDFSPTGANRDSGKSGKPHILVAGNDQLNRNWFEILLGRAGCLVDFASGADEALSLLETHHYQMIFIDRQLAETDGLETIKQIRRREGEGTRVPVVLLAAADEQTWQEEWLAAGADDGLAKPCAPDAFFAVIQRFFPGLLEAAEAGRTIKGRAPGGISPGAEPRYTTAEYMEALTRALNGRDFRNLETQAHSLRNLAVRAGSRAVADQAMRLQLAARGGDPHRAADAMERLRHALHKQPLETPTC